MMSQWQAERKSDQIMFTGLVQAIGHITAIEPGGQGQALRLKIACDMTAVALKTGDSVAVSGVCLTATTVDATGIWMDVSGETQACTTLGALKPGAMVNLEPALTPTTRLGGHLVSGHVDGVGTVIEYEPQARSQRLAIAVPAALMRYLAVKGSICVDGVSLTINQVMDKAFGVNIIPHTMAHTTIRHYQVGTRVNLEVDLIARYIEQLIQARLRPDSSDPYLDRYRDGIEYD